VALGHAGILLGLEVSRLARNSADWQRLLEVCALAGCLVGDEDGIYDPTYFNDRLLLGLKGTMLGCIRECHLHSHPCGRGLDSGSSSFRLCWRRVAGRGVGRVHLTRPRALQCDGGSTSPR
jgi:hypothetical protein